MRQEIAKLWAKYLRTPGLKQAKGRLGNPNDEARCCLGHLCDIAVTKGVIAPPTKGEKALVYGKNIESGVLPHEVVQWAHMRSPKGRFDSGPPSAYGYTTRFLDQINDGGTNLGDIADIIEKHAEEL